MERTPESLIEAASTQDASGNADHVLFRDLNDVEFFSHCSVNAGSVSLQTSSAGLLARVLRLFTTRSHPDLSAPVAGILLKNAVKMVLSGEELDGLQIINQNKRWVAYSRGELRSLMDQ